MCQPTSEDMKLYIIIKAELRRCVEVEVAVLGAPAPNKPTVSVDVKLY